MLTEQQYQQALNTRGWAFLFKKVTPSLLVAFGLALYAKHSDIHLAKRQTFFYNKSKLFGNAKNPQY